MDTLTVRAAQAGDQEAIAAIVDDFMPTVLGAAYGLCGNWETASDIAQETFAVGAASWSKVGEPAVSALATRAREAMTDELDEYLAQPFYIAHQFTGQPGESVPVSELRRRVGGLLPHAVGELPDDVAEH